MRFMDYAHILLFVMSLAGLSHTDPGPAKVTRRQHVSQRKIAERLCCHPDRWRRHR